jgi:iron complex outermembrane receptor protein
VDSPVARALGAEDLDPEKSVNLSVGATANPFRGLNLTADFYQIRINDRIVLTENLGPGNSALPAGQRDAIRDVLAAAGFPTIGAARFFINGLDTTTRGFDIIASYRWRPENMGNWLFTAAYNQNKTKINKRIAALGTLASIPALEDLVLFGREQGMRFTEGQPKNKVVLSADGEIGAFGLTARTTRYGKALAVEATAPLPPNQTDLEALGPDDQWLSPKWITDLEVRYELFEQVDLALGANNVFDVYPDRRPFGRRPDGGLYPQNFQYIPFSGAGSPFGFNGRFLYARVGVGF